LVQSQQSTVDVFLLAFILSLELVPSPYKWFIAHIILQASCACQNSVFEMSGIFSIVASTLEINSFILPSMQRGQEAFATTATLLG
jgi:hypothetical protein